LATRYLATYIFSLILLSLCVLVFIALEDPYYVNNVKLIKGVNEIKPEAYTHKVAAKRSLFLRGNYTTLILGNSRVDLGFNPLSKDWPVKFGTTFNFGLPGALLERNISNYYFAHKEGRNPENIILLIDFYNFITPRKTKSLEIGDQYIHPWLDGNFSLSALQDAVSTVRAQYIQNPKGMNIAGFNPVLPYNDMVRIEGHYNITLHSNKRSVQTFASRKKKRDNSNDTHSFDLELLTKFAKDLSKENIQFYVIFPPYHLDFHTIIKETDLSILFQAWKKAVVTAVFAGNTSAQVWDFATINHVTTENIPVKGDKQTKMKWYWEPGHFKSSVGDLIGCEIIEPKCSSHIGQNLTPYSEIKPIELTPLNDKYISSSNRIKKLIK